MEKEVNMPNDLLRLIRGVGAPLACCRMLRKPNRVDVRRQFWLGGYVGN